MPRKTISRAAIETDWFLHEWMDTHRVIAADIVRETGWPKSRVSEIVNGKTSYYREIVNELARVLRIHPFELLMHPFDAFAIRRLCHVASASAPVGLAQDQSREPLAADTSNEAKPVPRRRTG